MLSHSSSSPRKSLFEDLTKIFILAACSLCAGILINQFRSHPLGLVYQSKGDRIQQAAAAVAAAPQKSATAESSANTENLKPEVRYIELDEFKQLVDQKQVPILDARPEIFHRLGHVPNAIALPRDDFENFYPKVREKLEADKGQVLVLYCSGSHCEDSDLVSAALQKLGYKRIVIFRGGWNEWEKASLPVEQL